MSSPDDGSTSSSFTIESTASSAPTERSIPLLSRGVVTVSRQGDLAALDRKVDPVVDSDPPLGGDELSDLVDQALVAVLFGSRYRPSQEQQR